MATRNSSNHQHLSLALEAVDLHTQTKSTVRDVAEVPGEGLRILLSLLVGDDVHMDRRVKRRPQEGLDCTRRWCPKNRLLNRAYFCGRAPMRVQASFWNSQLSLRLKIKPSDAWVLYKVQGPRYRHSSRAPSGKLTLLNTPIVLLD